MAAATLAALQAGTLDKFQAKAVFLYKCIAFVDWPADAPAGTASFSLCVLGASPLEQVLAGMVGSRQWEGRPITVRRVDDSKQAEQCHLLAVTGEARKRFRTLRLELGRLTGLLVVGDSEGFATEGGTINFRLTDGRLRIEINTREAKRSKLAINSRLLNMAEIVGQ